MLADAAIKDFCTGVNESEALPFGRAVQFDSTGTTDRSIKIMNAATPLIMGISYHSHFAEAFDAILTGVAQVMTATVAGVATDGVYSFTVEGITVTVTRTAGVPATNNDIAVA